MCEFYCGSDALIALYYFLVDTEFPQYSTLFSLSFHNVLTNDDAERVWGCMENAITMMAEEENESETQS